MLFEKGDKLVMMGDSVTDCGRSEDGEGLHGGMGNGYPALVASMLTANHPEMHIRVVNKGVGGNRVPDMATRWETDVIAQKPDWVSIMIGINDVWRYFDQHLRPEFHATVQEYEAGLCDLIERTLPHVKGMILMTPFFMEPQKSDQMRVMIDERIAVVKALAAKYKLPLVDTQAMFDEFFTHLYSGCIAGDRVHPNLTGHLMLAQAFMKVVEA